VVACDLDHAGIGPVCASANASKIIPERFPGEHPGLESRIAKGRGIFRARGAWTQSRLIGLRPGKRCVNRLVDLGRAFYRPVRPL
jgi:hypothetical protein